MTKYWQQLKKHWDENHFGGFSCFVLPVREDGMVEVIFKPDFNQPHFYIIESINNSGLESQSRRLNAKSHVWRPATDVYEIDEAVVVRIEIAGCETQISRFC
jgi:hypothetical protein